MVVVEAEFVATATSEVGIGLEVGELVEHVEGGGEEKMSRSISRSRSKSRERM